MPVEAKVSVVIPAWIHGSFDMLRDSITSVLSQRFRDFHLIVVDDGSPVPVELDRLGIRDPRVRCLRQANGGPSIARNRGILHSVSEYVAFLDADDLWHPDKLGLQVTYMDAHPEAILCYTDYSRGESPASARSRLAYYRPRQPGDEFHDLLRENFVLTSSVLVRRSALSQSGLFDPSLKGPEDIDLWLRLARIGRFGFVDEILVHKIDHGNNLSSSPEFLRNSIVMIDRWLQVVGDGDIAHDLLLRKKRDRVYSLAYLCKRNGWLSEARQNYIACARLGLRPLKNYLAAGMLSLPKRVVKRLLLH